MADTKCDKENIFNEEEEMSEIVSLITQSSSEKLDRKKSKLGRNLKTIGLALAYYMFVSIRQRIKSSNNIFYLYIFILNEGRSTSKPTYRVLTYLPPVSSYFYPGWML